MSTNTELVQGNTFDKYGSSNIVYRYLVNKFIDDVACLVERHTPTSILDVGCADGKLAKRLFAKAELEDGDLKYVGMDLAPEQVRKAQAAHPGQNFICADARNIPFPDGSFDVVLALEVLEHVNDPERAMREIARVARRGVIVSVPWEPTWRILNLCRFRYVRTLGNTPGHLNHFTRTGICKLVANYCQIEEERRPLPWTILLGTPLHPQ